MIAEDVLRRLPELRERFQTARPFKHICVDDFFEVDAAENLLSDFPAFDRKNALNEFGEVGRKATVPELKDISPFYAEVHRYITSPEFLSAMSEMTGIPDLLPDPRMFGGGTHENRHGQGLSAHVDFNFDPAHGLHRRVNLILYLNKGWEESWGGAIELHSNPRDWKSNETNSFNCIFNRAVLFETNEYSWHGFPGINLPEDKRDTSRKSLSIYLYTKDRPAEEIAPPHGTFYVLSPLSFEPAAGAPLTTAQAKEIQNAICNRDQWIESYQGLELRLSSQIETARRYINHLLEETRAPVTGFAVPHGKSKGLFSDGWVEPYASFEATPRKPFSRVILRGWVPGDTGAPLTVSVFVNGDRATAATIKGGSFEIELPSVPQKGPVRFEIRTERRNAVKRTGADTRDLAFRLLEVEFSEPEPVASEPSFRRKRWLRLLPV